MDAPHFNFAGKIVLVVGGTSGIGYQTAAMFLHAGAHVVVAGPDITSGKEAEKCLRKLASADERLLFLCADVTIESEMQALVRETVSRFGRVDIAINNAGIEGRFGPLQELDGEEFDRIVAVNLKGIWHGMKYQIRQMLLQGGGVIVNTASSAGVNAIPMVGIYSASKHGVVGMTKAAALELASANIRVNAVAPGPVHTGLLERMVAGKIDLSAIAAQVPMGRIASPSEIGEAILWLASDASSFVTGHVLVLDGGMTVA